MSGFMFEGISEEEEEDDKFVNRECYVFNKNMERMLDDARCIHCRHYLTLQCKHVDEFVDEDGEA
jgi:hypothetical protein